MAAGSPDATSRANFFARFRRESRDGPGETSKRSRRPSFINRLYPAETRLKEGAHAHDSDQNRWECSLAAGWWRPVSALAGSIRALPLRCQTRQGWFWRPVHQVEEVESQQAQPESLRYAWSRRKISHPHEI